MLGSLAGLFGAKHCLCSTSAFSFAPCLSCHLGFVLLIVCHSGLPMVNSYVFYVLTSWKLSFISDKSRNRSRAEHMASFH